MGYSADLRERIVEATLKRRFSIREAASTVRVGHTTVERYLRRYRKRGELTPCKPPGRPSRVNGERSKRPGSARSASSQTASGRGETRRTSSRRSFCSRFRVVVLVPPGYGDLNEMLVALGPEDMVTRLDAAAADVRAGETSDLLYVRSGCLAELDVRAYRPHAAYSTGLEALDGLLDGGYLEGLHLLGGITGGGKTSLALSVALHNALAGRPVLYGSYEQSRLELWARIASRLTRLPYSAIKRGTYDGLGTATLVSSELRASEGWAQLEGAARHIRVVEGGDALSRTEGAYTVDFLARTAEQMAEARGAPPLIILDYLQRMPVPAELRIKDTRERVSYVAGQLQVTLARGIECLVLALSSVGRAAYRLGETDLEGRLAAFKEAGELEYTASTSRNDIPKR